MSHREAMKEHGEVLMTPVRCCSRSLQFRETRLRRLRFQSSDLLVTEPTCAAKDAHESNWESGIVQKSGDVDLVGVIGYLAKDKM